MLSKIKLLLGISDTSKDELLQLLVEVCTEEALTYTHREESNTALDNVIVLMVVESYNKLGAEGVTSRSFSGISESITEGYSERVTKLLNTQRKVRLI